ncbi:hypothetical protein B0H17DRAFT_495124 [Mycena rosella]|uniref:Uncharacterized protein n=1 Tax=Mycena rosella TaxID=1033263 RepID=A0AAD7C332_MYCRO|nr:hypothetical protein B0H17DRAFT_495124 [Mycena rosella]
MTCFIIKVSAKPTKAPIPAKVSSTGEKAPTPSKPVPSTTKKSPVAGKKVAAQKSVCCPPAEGSVMTCFVIKVSAKPTKAPVGKKPTTKPPVTSCPAPTRKTTARRFLEYIGLLRSTTPGACPPVAGASAPAAAAAPASGLTKSQQNAAAIAAALKQPKRPVGTVANEPTTDIVCNNRQGGTDSIPLADIKDAIKLAQEGPVLPNPVFPHVFNNNKGQPGGPPEVNVDPACAGKQLEEYAVGPGISAFQNTAKGVAKASFNTFRVLITTPDAKGNTRFCGVMTHGTAGSAFENALCTPKRPVGSVNNAPTKDVECNNSKGRTTVIPVADIKSAVTLAQQGPLVPSPLFPNSFNNIGTGGKPEVAADPACAGTLEQYAVGVGMGAFTNDLKGVAKANFKTFRVLITTPDANGNTRFCGVMTHGKLGTAFENALCPEVS